MYLPLSMFVIFSIFTVYIAEEHTKLFKLFTINRWVITFIITIIWSVYILIINGIGLIPEYDTSKLHKYKNATCRAIIAFFIAVLVYLDVTLVAYCLLWVIAFHLYDHV